MPYEGREKRLACKRASNAKHAETRREWAKKYYAANPEKKLAARAATKAWYEKHRAANSEKYLADRVVSRAYSKTWRATRLATNPEEVRSLGRAAAKKHRAASPEKERARQTKYQSANLEKNRMRLRARRALLVTILGGKCVDCNGTSKIEFDHVDPKTKSFDVSSGLSRNLDTLLAELAKCELRCYDCHVVKSRTDGSKPGRPRKLAARQRGRFMPYTQSALAMPRRLRPTTSGRLASRNSSRPEAPIVGRPLLSVG